MLGGPGTGKTTELRDRFCGLVTEGADPERIGFITLTRRAARATRRDLVARLRRSLPDLPVFTVHGFAYEVLGRRFADLDPAEPPIVLSAGEQVAVVRELLSGEQARDWPRLGHLLENLALARDLAAFILRAQERMLDPETLEGHAERAGLGEVARFYRRYLDTMALEGRADLAGLVARTAGLIGDGEAMSFDHLLVDDYQDTTYAGEAIIAALGRRAVTVTVAADPGGSVFGSRGASGVPLARIDEILGPCDRVALGENHRLGDAAAAVAALGGGDAATPTQRIVARSVAHPGEEAEAIAHTLLEARVHDDLGWSEMAVVLRRYGPFVSTLRHALDRHSIPHVVVGEAAELPSEPALRPLLDLLRYALRPDRRDDLLEPLLSSAIGGLDAHALRRLRRAARLAGRSVAALVADPPAGMAPDLRSAAVRLTNLAGELPQLAAERTADEILWELWGRLPHHADLVAREDSRALDALWALSDTLARFSERRKGATILDYLEALDNADFAADPRLLPEERHPGAVRIMTAHHAHGVELGLAVVAGCVEGEFPRLRRAEPIVDLDRLLAPAPSPRDRLAARLAEERRLFRLAISRSRGRTVLFAARGATSREPRTPTRFADRLGLVWEPDGAVVRETAARTLEASFRRIISDSAAEPGRRLAALASLQRVAADPRSWWGRRGWTDPGVPMYGDDLRTSYSRLDPLDNCPLQYLYRVEMGLDPERTHQMWLGSLVHEIIDETQRGEIERSVEELHRVLAERWQSGMFPNRAIEHRKLLDARMMLYRWVHGEKAEVRHSEVSFTFPLDGATIRGKIDAVFDMDNGNARVVDYKTGRMAPSKDEVKENLQLAAYFLALRRADELRGIGKPGYLELAFLAKRQGDDGYMKRGFSPGARDGYEEWAESTIRTLLRTIRAESFGPAPDANCYWCDFKTICPLWSEGRDPT